MSDKPLFPHELVKMKPILATEEPRAEYMALRERRSLYVSTTGGEEPKVELEQLKASGKEAVWRIDIQQGSEQQGGVPPVREIVREPPEFFLKSIKSSEALEAYRPPWADLFYLPRYVPSPSPAPIRRFNGRLVHPQMIWLPDDRHRLYDYSWPWGCIGKVRGVGSGTGALVGPNLVITASHVIPWDQPSIRTKFVPAYDAHLDGSRHGPGFEAYVDAAAWWYDQNTDGHVAGWDFALLRLDRPLGQWLGYFGAQVYNDDWEDWQVWGHVGYPHDLGGGGWPFVQHNVAVFDDDGDSKGSKELETKADADYGQSGGPLWSWFTDGSPRIIGVLSGYAEDWQFPYSFQGAEVFAGGQGFVNLILWGRSNWPP